MLAYVKKKQYLCTRIMKRVGYIVRLWVLMVVLCAFVACRNSEEANVAKMQAVAEQRTEQLCEALLRNSSLDTIRAIAESRAAYGAAL